MLNKIIYLGIVLVMIFLLVACSNKIPYNAELYDDAGQWIYEEFLIENLTRGALYEDVFLDDISYPKNITHLIRSKEEFEAIFIEFPSEIDFTQSMVLIYIFTCNYKRSYEISKISMDNQVLKIQVKSILPIKGYFGDAVPSWQRCLVVVIDKLDIISVEFAE